MRETSLVEGPDGRLRTSWAYDAPEMLRYYDEEWGMPVRDDAGVFERLSLEAFQSGLSWITVLRKRDALREVFHDFDPAKVAFMTETDVESLLTDQRIIRNRHKVEATITNARAALDLEGGLAAFVWGFKPEENLRPTCAAEIPAVTEESKAMAKALKSRGFRFVGPTMCCALMMAIGMIDAREVGSWRRGASGVWPN